MGPTPVPKTKLWVSLHLLCASTPGAVKGASHAGVVTFTENNIPPTKLTARRRKDGINTEDLDHVGHRDPLGKQHKNHEVTLCPASHLPLDRYIDLLAQEAPHLSTCHLSPPAALTGSTLNPPTTGCGARGCSCGGWAAFGWCARWNQREQHEEWVCVT